jgi:citrate synthase
MSRNLLTADQVATQLGVKLETVYAYVSRGVLTRTTADDGRTSRFDASEVEGLARRGRPRRNARRAGVSDVVLSTSLTAMQDDRLFFRGHDATVLARTATFETVAELLWTGALPATASWSARPDAVRVAGAVSAPLPETSPVAERLGVVVAALGCTEPLRVDLQTAAVAAHARSMLTVFVEALVRRGRDPEDRASRRRGVATALWPRLSSLPATRARTRVLDGALILLADHELATSTLAARIAASAGADPYAVVATGLGAASGPLHGKAAIRVHQLLTEADHLDSAEQAVARALGPRGLIPGFGHPIYAKRDPRADCLMELLQPLLNRRTGRVLSDVRETVATTTPALMNVDFVLGVLAYVARMPLGLTEAIFVIARTAGWVAHALEEYGEDPLRFRARAVYTGPAPIH